MDKTSRNDNLDKAPLPKFNKPLNYKEILNDDKKKELLQNYNLTDLSHLQEIEFKFQTNKEKIILYPKMEIEINGIDYYIFYNDDLNKLKKIFLSKLDDITNEHYIILDYDKSALYEKANSSNSKSKSKLPIQVWRMIGNLIGPQSYLFAPYNLLRKVVSYSDSNITKLAKVYANVCANLNYLNDTFGSEIIEGKICYIIIKKTFDDYISFNNEEEFSTIESAYSSIFKSGLPDDKFIQNLYILTKNLLKTNDSVNEKYKICFILFRANYYLGKYESDLQNKDIKTLDKMDKFKKYLFKSYLNYRFPVSKNISPFQNIKINNCHIIQQNDEKTIIYMNRAETQRYIKLINETLVSKIGNLTSQYNLTEFKDNELLELVKSIDYNSYEDIERFMEHKIIDMEAEKKMFENKGMNICIKSGVKIIKKGSEVILDIESKSKQVNFSEKEFYDSFEEERKNINSFSMNKFLKGSFDNPKNIVVYKPSQNYKQSPESKIETVAFPNKEMIKKKNLSVVRKSLMKLNLDNEIDDFFNGLNYYISSSRLEKHINILKKQKNQLMGIKEYMGNIINLTKLYCQLKKKNLDINDKYEGIILTEKKSLTNNSNNLKECYENELLLEYNILVFE